MSTVERVAPEYLHKEIFASVTPELRRVDAELCERGFYQTRLDFDEEGMRDLSASVAATGGNVLPVILRPKRMGAAYEIIAGERRVRACMMAQVGVLALVADYDDQQAATIALIENVQREDLNPIEEAEGYQLMMNDLELRQQDVADMVGKSRSYVANALRLLDLDGRVKELLVRKKVEVGHAKILAGLSRPEQRELASKITLNEWSVRALIDHLKKKGKVMECEPPSHNPDRDVANLEDELSEITGSPVRITTDTVAADKYAWQGKVTISFFDREEFSGIEARLRGASHEEAVMRKSR